MISKMFTAVVTLLLLLMVVGQANARETGEIAFVFISESGAEYTYRLHGPESNFWIGSVHAGSTVVIDGPPVVQYTGSIALLAERWADIIFDDFSIAERADNLAPAAESTTTGTQTDTAKVVFTNHTPVVVGTTESTTPTITYVVKSGDSLIEIAKKLNVDPDVLAAANNGIVNTNLLTPGQVLLLKFDSYSVRSGDSLTSIARLFGVSLEELVSLNEIVDLNSIYTGQRLSIPE